MVSKLINFPGYPRPVLIDLHDGVESDKPWFAEVGTEISLSPEEFAKEMAAGNFVQTAEGLSLVKVENQAEAELLAEEALRLEEARRAQLKIKSGRPRNTVQFSHLHNFVVIALYFQSLGDRRFILSAEEYWALGSVKAPTRRRIDKKLKQAREWATGDIRALAEVVRKLYKLPPLPLKKVASRKKK